MLCFRIDHVLMLMLMSLVQALQNEDRVENTLGSWDYKSFIFFVFHK